MITQADTCDDCAKIEDVCPKCQKYFDQLNFEMFDEYLRFAGRNDAGELIDVREAK